MSGRSADDIRGFASGFGVWAAGVGLFHVDLQRAGAAELGIGFVEDGHGIELAAGLAATGGGGGGVGSGGTGGGAGGGGFERRRGGAGENRMQLIVGGVAVRLP